MASVLVVDDDAASRHYLRELFHHRGHRVREAPDGEAALRIAAEQQPDAVFTDVLMPGLDGCELARMLRSRPATAAVPIVFTTAHYDRAEIHPLARACGVRHILRKPAKPAAVLAVVDALLSGDEHPDPEPDPDPAGRDFTEQHRTALKAKLLQTTTALRDCQAREDQLRQEVNELRGILAEPPETTAAGVWHLDPRSGAVLLSVTLVDQLGLPARLDRREIWQRVHPEDRAALAAAAVAARREGRAQTAWLRFADSDGNIRELAVTCRSAGRDRTWGIAQDLTETGQEQRLRVRTSALVRAERLISDSWHAAMVPRQPPTLPDVDLATAYLTAPDRTDTGADWYDTMPLPGGQLLISIGSVAAHLLPGPTVAGPLRAVLRAYALDDPDPAELLARLNDYLIATTDDDSYVTALVALYDTGQGTLRLSNAGHPAPLVIRHNAGGVPTVHAVPAAHPPLGIDADADYDTQQLPVEAATSICAYTDGLADTYLAVGPDQPGLVEVLTAVLTTAPGQPAPTAQRTLDRILGTVLPNTARGDDIGVLVLGPPR